MNISFYSDMDPSEPRTPNSTSEKSMSSTEAGSPTGSPKTQNPTSAPFVKTPNVETATPGWPALAKIIADNTALEAFPSFADLNVKSLLYYQAELVLLRKKLHFAEFNDHRNGDAVQKRFAGNLQGLINNVRDKPPEEQPKQWRLIEEIRLVLDKYNTALIQYSKVSAFPDADSLNVLSVRDCAGRAYENRGITGSGSTVWGTLCGELEGTPDVEKPFWKLILGLFLGLFKIQEDQRPKVPDEFQECLIVPRLGSKPDGLTLWVAHSFIPLYHRVWKRHGEPTWDKLWARVQKYLHPPRLPVASPKPDAQDTPELGKGLTSYSSSWIMRVTSLMTTILACLLPVIAIVILSRVHTMGLILGLIAVFNTVFAFGLVMISSSSSRVEIFTATAAFSAVMVVFVQNKLSPK